MTWFKVDDNLALHPKVLAAGNAAMGLWVRAGSWCAANLTDGSLPTAMVSPLGGRRRDAERLCEVGLWGKVDGGYQFKNWPEYQPTKVEIKRDREATAKRVSEWRERQRNTVTNTVTNGVQTAPRPVPSRPERTTPNGVVEEDTPRRSRETLLPSTWQPTPEHIHRAAETSLDLLVEAEKFRAHAATNERRAKNWNAAFTSWLIKAAEYAEKDRRRERPLDRQGEILRREMEAARAHDARQHRGEIGS